MVGCKVPGAPVFMRWRGAGKIVSKPLLADVEAMDERELNDQTRGKTAGGAASLR